VRFIIDLGFAGRGMSEGIVERGLSGGGDLKTRLIAS